MTNSRLLSDQRRYVLEANLTARVKDWLSIQPDISFYKASDRYHKGVSDIIACVKGIFVAIELKAVSGVASAHQKLFIREIIRVGGIGGECFTLADVKELVEQARRKAVDKV